MFQVDQHIGPYTLVRRLGRGGAGEVWLAVKRSALLSRQVALKLPLDPDPDLAVVKEEAQIWLHAGHHPNVLPVIDADVSEGQVWIASEYASGGSLNEWLRQHGGQAPSLDAALEMAVGILAGLEHLHGLRPQPIVHRDLKPDNVLLQGGVPRLTDFGISRALKTTGHTNHASGTPSYMPPEAFSGRYSEQTDIWAMGVVLYRMLAGRLPFPQGDQVSLLGAIVHGEFDPLPLHLPETVRAVVARALAKHPRQRFATAREMRLALSAIPVDSQSQTLWDPGPAPRKPDPPVGRRAALTILGLGALATGAWWLQSRPSRGNSPDSGSSGEKADSGAGSRGSDGSTANGGGGVSPPPTKKKNQIDEAPMVFIPAGSFQMGVTGPQVDEILKSDTRLERKWLANALPQHLVYLSGYWMYDAPVTVAMFRNFCNEGHYTFEWDKNKPDWDWQDLHPMVNANWTDAKAYCNWARVSLPTEAQFERAARGPEEFDFSWGNTFDGTKCANSVGTTRLTGTVPVRSYPQNGYGLYDMAGNVWEWCEDWYDENYYSKALAQNPINLIEGTGRVVRGGSWGYDDPFYFRAAFRGWYLPTLRSVFYGFRCASGP